MIKRTLLIDPLNQGISHVYINTTLAQCITGHKIFIGNKSHIKNIETLFLGCDYIGTRETNFTLSILKKFEILIKKTAFKKEKILFLCFDNTLVPLFLFFAFPVLFRSSLSLVVHNNITTLLKNSWKQKLHRLIIKLYDANVFVLTKEMEGLYKENILNIKKCAYLPHPNYSELVEVKGRSHTILNHSKTNVVLLGRQAGLLVDYLKEFDFHTLHNIHFIIVYQKSLTWLENQKNITQIKEKLPFESYYTLLKEADFCLFAPDDSVKKRASGILMDCITVKCPIITPDFGHFLEYKKFKLGYLYNNQQELVQIFKNIDHNKMKRAYFESNFEGAIRFSSVDKVKAIIEKYSI